MSRPIIGADFFAFYGLLVDLRNNRLIDQITNLITPERCVQCNTLRGDNYRSNKIPQIVGAISGASRNETWRAPLTSKTFYSTSYQNHIRAIRSMQATETYAGALDSRKSRVSEVNGQWNYSAIKE